MGGALDSVVPLLVTPARTLGPRLGDFTLLPLSLSVEREYGNYARLLGVAGVLVASASFGPEGIGAHQRSTDRTEPLALTGKPLAASEAGP